MTIPVSFLQPTWPAANYRASVLLPLDAEEVSPRALTSGVVFSRQGSAIPSVDTVADTWPGYPPYITQPSDEGAAEFAWLLSADNAFPAPAGATTAPEFVDFLFSQDPARNLPPVPGSSLMVTAWCFVNQPASQSLWSPMNSLLVTENQRVRVPWARLAGTGGVADASGQLVDALAFVVQVPSARTIAPASFTFAIQAVYQ